MNQSAQQHVARAKSYLASGDEAYTLAAKEMRAAKDEGATWVEIADALDRDESWCRKIVTWAETPANRRASSPFLADEKATHRASISHTRQILRDAPMEQVEQIISELPASRQRQIGAAAKEEYLSRVNEVADNTRRNVTQGVDGLFWPDIDSEKRSLLRKLDEIKTWLAQHGDDMVPEPLGEAPPEPARDIMLDSLRSEKAEIDAAFADLGVGTSIEEGFNSLLSES